MQEEIPINNLWQFCVDHMIEVLFFKEKVDLMNYIYSLESIERGTIESLIKNYFVKQSIYAASIEAVVLFNLNKMSLMILNKKNEWVKGEPEDERKIRQSEEGKVFFDKLLRASYNQIIGFVGYEKGNKYLIFKTKNLDSSRDTGARCDEAGKSKTLTLLNKILGTEKYTSENTKKIVGKDNVVIQEAILQTELCVIEEYYLRYFNFIEKNGLKWFFTPEMALYHDFKFNK